MSYIISIGSIVSAWSMCAFVMVFFFCWTAKLNDSLARVRTKHSVAFVMRKTASAFTKFTSGSSLIMCLTLDSGSSDILWYKLGLAAAGFFPGSSKITSES